MNTLRQDIEKITNMSCGNVIDINMSEESGGEVHRHNDGLVLYEIPLYGGEGNLVATYQFNKEGIEGLVTTVHSWT
jgi:hypothetical protein